MAYHLYGWYQAINHSQRYNVSNHYIFPALLYSELNPEQNIWRDDLDELVQERRNSSALAMELRLSCTNPSIWYGRNEL